MITLKIARLNITAKKMNQVASYQLDSTFLYLRFILISSGSSLKSSQLQQP